MGKILSSYFQNVQPLHIIAFDIFHFIELIDAAYTIFLPPYTTVLWLC